MVLKVGAQSRAGMQRVPISAPSLEVHEATVGPGGSQPMAGMGLWALWSLPTQAM